jgi:hypothetical protein
MLTKRGKIVRNVFIGLLLVGLFAIADKATTPKECRVSVDKMSQGCKDLLYP